MTIPCLVTGERPAAAIPCLVTDATEERRARWRARERGRPMRLVGSAMTTCLECGETFPDTGGGHWPGECLLVLRRIRRHIDMCMPKKPRMDDEDEMRRAIAGVARRAVVADRIRRLLRRIGDHETDGISGITFTPASLGVNPGDLP